MFLNSENLEEALAGRRVLLKNGKNAVIVSNLHKINVSKSSDYPLIGYQIDEQGEIDVCVDLLTWTADGYYYNEGDSVYDIIGFAPSPVILPVPVKFVEPGRSYFLVNMKGNSIKEKIFNNTTTFKSSENTPILFNTRKEAEDFLNKIRSLYL